ncbi:MAG TPA: hypothetical protein VF590_02090, partial [Isosphaeraceae bacterium]
MPDPVRSVPDATVSRRAFVGGVTLGAAAVPPAIAGQDDGPGPDPRPIPPPPAAPAPFAVNGVVPSVGVSAGLKGPRSESGIGALMPWGGRLWFVTYTAHTASTGSGTGLYWVDEAMTRHRHEASVVGTYANRLVHGPSEQMIIGPHIINADNQVRTFADLVTCRLTATMTHLDDPEHKVYFLGMESHLWEADVRTLKVKLLFELNRELKHPAGLWPHYKGGFTAGDRVIVANNTYDERDQTRSAPSGGRLAEWDGRGTWRILEETAFNEVTGRRGGHLAQAVAVGWDRASVLLRILHRGQWTRYRLPKASHAYDHGWYTEWPRVREVETERFLMDAHGLFYELSPLAYGGRIWGVRPICQHLRMVPDFCSWKGLLVLAGDQATAVGGNDLVGEPQANLWFGATDDLWGFGRPQGWGGPWYQTEVRPGEPSDPYLMTGFVHKVLHLTHDADVGVHFAIEVDFLGDGTWGRYATLTVGGKGYIHHEFPAGF